jgi:ABC-type transport system substrate-binding protein
MLVKLTNSENHEKVRQVLRVPDTIPLVDGPFSRRQLQRGELPAPIAHDPAQALLDAAGWRASGGDRVRERNGRPFRFTAMVHGRSREIRRPPCTFRISSGGWAPAWKSKSSIRATSMTMRSGRFEAAIKPYQEGRTPLFGERSWIGYSNAAAARPTDRLETTLDPDACDAIYRDLTAICRAEVPVTFLCPWVGTVVAHRRLSSLGRAGPVEYMEDLWLDDRDAPK